MVLRVGSKVSPNDRLGPRLVDDFGWPFGLPLRNLVVASRAAMRCIELSYGKTELDGLHRGWWETTVGKNESISRVYL